MRFKSHLIQRIAFKRGCFQKFGAYSIYGANATPDSPGRGHRVDMVGVIAVISSS